MFSETYININLDIKNNNKIFRNLNLNVSNFSVYYGSVNDSIINYLNKYDLVILQHWAVSSYNLSKIKAIKIAYIDLGEYDNSTYPNCTINLTGIVIGYDNQWNQPIVNVSSQKWINYTICRVKYDIKLGFNGVMFDDLDVVEEYPWEASGFIKIISLIRQEFKNIYIGINRGFELIKNVSEYINFVLYEDFGTYYNFNSNGYNFLNFSQLENLSNNINEIKSYGIQVLALGYSPADCNYYTYFDSYIANKLNVPLYIGNWNLTSLYNQCNFTFNLYEIMKNYNEMIVEQANYILNSQLDDGAIKISINSNEIIPYISNIASIGLIYAYELTGNESYLNSAKKWIEWYSIHQNINKDNEGIVGTIYNYNISNGLELSTNYYNSSDSYAATFLILIYDYYNLTGNITFIKEEYKNIKLALNAIFSTMDNNLTYAKPNLKVKYLIDNSEVYLALHDSAKIFKLFNVSYSNYLNNISNSVKYNILNYFLINNTFFDWSINGTINISNYYPDINANYWPIIFGVIKWNSSISNNIFNFLLNLSYYNQAINITNLDLSAAYYSTIMGRNNISQIIINSILSMGNYTNCWNVEDSSWIIQSYFLIKPDNTVIKSFNLKYFKNILILNLTILKNNNSKILIYIPWNFYLYSNCNYSNEKFNNDSYIDINNFDSNNISLYYFFNNNEKYMIKIIENGIKNKSWGVIINNKIFYSNNNSIIIYLPAGLYKYSIIPENGFYVMNATGYLLLFKNDTIYVNFIKTLYYYNVTFILNGSENLTWYIKINNMTYEVKNISITLREINGTYFYSIIPPDGYIVNKTNGVFIVNGSDIIITLEIKKVENYNYLYCILIFFVILLSLIFIIKRIKLGRGP
ncbi:MAG: hypothetical protein ACP5GR_00855 [Thermoplasmata archaeon]